MEQKYKVEQIFTKNYARLCAMATAILHDSSLAQDAVQEGWIRLHKAKQLDTSSEEKLEHLILITVRHAAYNIMRKGNPEPIEDSILNSIPDTSPSPHEIVESREVSRKIKNSLRNLSETDRSIIQLQYGQGYTSTQIAALVIASEDNIEDEENYKTFKEKVVERTVKLDMEYRRIQQEMIEDYKTETSEYKEFLKKESPKLFQVFEESGSRNLRTFKSCLIDFERVYGLWHSLKLPTDGMGEALYVFAAYLFEVKGGNYKKMDEYDEYHFNFLEEKAEDKKRNPPRWQTTQDGENSKYKRYNAQYRIQPLIRWMIEGEWNEQRIKAALNQRFSVKETAPEREVLDKAFWELSQEIIDRGLPQVLQQAYDGKLTTDDYVALLGRLDDFRKIGVPIQCDVDDARLLQGFHNRKAKIIKGDICEERGHRRLMRDEGETKLTPQEQSLNEEIEKLQDQWPYLMNEIFFIDYLKNPTYERGLAAKSKILVCFNDELLAAFLSAYKKANISEQQEMLTILKEISFRGGAVERDETDTEVTRKNLEKLENALNSEVEHTSDAVKKFYANRHLETVKQIRQKFLNTREM